MVSRDHRTTGIAVDGDGAQVVRVTLSTRIKTRVSGKRHSHSSKRHVPPMTTRNRASRARTRVEAARNGADSAGAVHLTGNNSHPSKPVAIRSRRPRDSNSVRAASNVEAVSRVSHSHRVHVLVDGRGSSAAVVTVNNRINKAVTRKLRSITHTVIIVSLRARVVVRRVDHVETTRLQIAVPRRNVPAARAPRLVTPLSDRLETTRFAWFRLEVWAK